MRHQGRITTWKDDHGFGFITPDGGGQQVFVHIKSFSNRQRRPIGNEMVRYKLTTDAKARTRAENVAFVGDGAAVNVSLGGRTVSLTLATLFLSFVATSVFTKKLPLAVLALYLAASIVAFVAYLIDKSAARGNRWRTEEGTLHLFGLIGGWPGALLAQNFLRHKSRKMSFQVVFWVTVALNCGALGWLFSPDGSTALRNIVTLLR
jgi:uncharacterized membrane protein YsdA (DUF1294 family)/cold shock CspA family protein